MAISQQHEIFHQNRMFWNRIVLHKSNHARRWLLHYGNKSEREQQRETLSITKWLCKEEQRRMVLCVGVREKQIAAGMKAVRRTSQGER